MSRILVTIEAGGRRLDTAVPPHLTSLDLLAWIGRTMGPFDDDRPRSLTMPDGSEIEEGKCLASVGVLDGMTLRAVTPGAAPPPPEPHPRQTESPDLPAALTTFERLLVTARAVRGRAHPTGRDGPWARAVLAWRWTDHGRRLRWLITRPAAPRAPATSVSGHRSAEIAEQLALAFASTRTEPVVLVDGDPAGRLSRHVERSGSWEAIARDLTDPALGRLQRDRLLARSPAGIPLVSAAEGITEHIEGVVRALSRGGAIVIVDEGPTPQESPVGDQAVISTFGHPITTTGAIIVAWGPGAAAISDGGARHVLMDGKPFRMLELAAIVAGRWAGVGDPNQITGSSGEALRLSSSGPSGRMTRFSS